jgi:hypothetical protein
LAAALLTLLAALYFGWAAHISKQLAEDSREKVIQVTANKALLDIQSLRVRGETLWNNGYYRSALEMLEQADTLALRFPDVPNMQQQHRELVKKITQCKQEISQ